MPVPHVFPKLLPQEPVWSTEDSAALRAYLTTPSGQQFLRRLFFQRPTVTERRSFRLRQVQSDERAGYEACIADALQLAETAPVTDQDREVSAESIAALVDRPAR